MAGSADQDKKYDEVSMILYQFLKCEGEQIGFKNKVHTFVSEKIKMSKQNRYLQKQLWKLL